MRVNTRYVNSTNCTSLKRTPLGFIHIVYMHPLCFRRTHLNVYAHTHTHTLLYTKTLRDTHNIYIYIYILYIYTHTHTHTHTLTHAYPPHTHTHTHTHNLTQFLMQESVVATHRVGGSVGVNSSCRTPEKHQQFETHKVGKHHYSLTSMIVFTHLNDCIHSPK